MTVPAQHQEHSRAHMILITRAAIPGPHLRLEAQPHICGCFYGMPQDSRGQHLPQPHPFVEETPVMCVHISQPLALRCVLPPLILCCLCFCTYTSSSIATDTKESRYLSASAAAELIVAPSAVVRRLSCSVSLLRCSRDREDFGETSAPTVVHPLKCVLSPDLAYIAFLPALISPSRL